MANTALVIVDVQVGLFDNPKSEIYAAETLLGNVNTLIREARSTKTPIIFIRHNDPGLPFDSPAWQIHGSLERRDGDIYIDKKHCDSFFETDLEDVLRKNSIDRIVVCGLQTEYCVDTACRSAAGRNIETTLVEDAHSTRDSKVLQAKQIIAHHNESLGAAFVKLVSTKEILF